jgi:thioredoxin-related protein
MARTENQRAVSRWLFIVAGVLVAARIAVAFIPQRHESTSLVKWIAIGDAKARSSQSNKRILYEFSAAWCGPCKMMERDVFNDARMASLINDDFIPVRVVDRQQEEGSNPRDVETLQRTYGVRAFPTVVVADSNGAFVRKVEGYEGAEAFERFVNASRTTH